MRDYLTQDPDSLLKAKAPGIRREDRIHMARSAFGKENGKIDREEYMSGSSGHIFRLVAAGVLFIVFVLLSYFDVSFHGYDKQWLEQCLQDNHLWEQVTGVVADCVNRLRGY